MAWASSHNHPFCLSVIHPHRLALCKIVYSRPIYFERAQIAWFLARVYSHVPNDSLWWHCGYAFNKIVSRHCVLSWRAKYWDNWWNQLKIPLILDVGRRYLGVEKHESRKPPIRTLSQEFYCEFVMTKYPVLWDLYCSGALYADLHFPNPPTPHPNPLPTRLSMVGIGAYVALESLRLRLT